MHCIVRNFWLDNRPELLRRLQANTISNEVLETTTLPRWVTIVILLAQFPPFCFCSLWHRLMSTWPILTRASRGACRSTVQAVFGPNLANNLFASSCNNRRLINVTSAQALAMTILLSWGGRPSNTKHLFVAAKVAVAAAGGSRDDQWDLFSPEFRTGLGINPDGGRGPFPPCYRAPQKRRRTGGASS